MTTWKFKRCVYDVLSMRLLVRLWNPVGSRLLTHFFKSHSVQVTRCAGLITGVGPGESLTDATSVGPAPCHSHIVERIHCPDFREC